MYNGLIYPEGESAFTKLINAVVTIDFGSVSAGVQLEDQQTIAGAVLGDLVLVTGVLDYEGLQIWGYVSAANTVEVVASNSTAGAVDLASGTFYIKVFGMV